MDLNPQEAADLVGQNGDNAPPTDLNPQQAANLVSSGQVEADIPEQMGPDEAAHHLALAKMNGNYAEGDAPVDENPGLGSGNTYGAANAFYAAHDGWFRKTLYSMSIPEQFITRQVTAALSGMGAMSGDTAKKLLSQQQLMPSSLIDYYWKADSKGSENLKTLTGLVSDIVLDPMNMIGVGEGEKAIDVVGKTITGLEKMSTTQKAAFKTMSGIEKILDVDGAVLHADDAYKAEEVTQKNLEMLSNARDQYQSGNPLSFEGLNKSLNLSEDGQKAAQSVMLEGLTDKSAAQQLADGSRDLTVGLRVPFTNLAWEVKMPGPMSQVVGKGASMIGTTGISMAALGGISAGMPGAIGGLGLGAVMNTMGPKAMQAMNEMAEFANDLKNMSPEDMTGKQRALNALDNAFGLSNAYAGAVGVSQESMRFFQNLWTKTGDVGFNDGMMRSLNLKGETERQLAQQENAWQESLQTVKDRTGPNQFKSLMEDFLGEAESGIYSPEEAKSMVAKFRPDSGDEALLDAQDLERTRQLTEASPEDAARAMRVAAHPELTEILGTMRDQLQTMVGKYAERNMPFEELNPFGPGWMRRYVKHSLTGQFRDYLAKSGTAEDEFIKAMKGSEDMLGTFDQSAVGRQYRGSILDANEESMSRTGLKMFVDNPIELFNTRVSEMQNAVAKHDLISSAMPGSITGYNPGFGWMKLDPQDFGHLESTVQVDRKTYKALSFLPEDLRNKIANDQSVYFRSDVYDRMLWNTEQQGGRVGQFANTLAAADTYTWFWRNQTLGNFGYVGTKFFHNMLSYFGLMQNTNPVPLFKAMRAMTVPGEEAFVNWKQLDGTVQKLNYEGLMDLAQKHGVLNTGTEVLFDDVLDHAASAYNKPALSPKTWINYAYGFGAFRSLAQYGDELPKLASFIDRLEKGFTAEAAAENSIRYFYNFHPVTPQQQIAKDLIPFISFPMKTAELVASQIKNGDLAQLAMPGHIQDALRGKWIDDRDTRDYLSKVLPNYRNWYEPLHGGLTPGMRSMSIELPWCYNTLSALWNEDMRPHPLLQMLVGLAAVKHNGNELDSPTDDPTFSRVIGDNLVDMLPKPAKLALELTALNGTKFPGSDYLIQRYQSKAPTASGYMSLASGQNILGDEMGKFSLDNEYMAPSEAQVAKSALNTRFKNSVDFGKWMDQSYGSSWLYNMMFHGSLDKKGPAIYQDEQTATRGEYLRQHLRDLSLGLVEMDKLDQTMLSKYFATDRDMKNKKQQMLDQANKTFALVDPDKALSNEALKEAETNGIPQAKQILKLKDEQNALVLYYDYMVGARKQAPDFSLYKLLFGIDQLQMAPDGKPGPEVTDALHPKTHMIPDERASRFFNEEFVKKQFPSK